MAMAFAAVSDKFGTERMDGAVSTGAAIAGCYIHGLFAHDAQRARWLQALGAAPSELSYESRIETTLDELAAHLEQHISVDRLLEIACRPTSISAL